MRIPYAAELVKTVHSNATAVLSFRIAPSSPQATSFSGTTNVSIMRVAFVLLAAMAVITGSAAIDAESATVSTKTLTGQVSALDTAVDDTNGKRFLRSHEAPKDDDDDVDDDDEARINFSKLNDLAKGKTKSQFTHWGNQKLPPTKVWEKLKGLSRDDRQKVYDWYYKDIYRYGAWRR